MSREIASEARVGTERCATTCTVSLGNLLVGPLNPLERGAEKLSLSAPPDVSPRKKLSIVGAFQSAPTLVKALAACLYLEALLRLGEAFAVIPGLGDDSSDVMANARVVFLGLALALIPFLLGNGVARGWHHAWLLTLVLVVVEIPFDVRSVLTGVTVISILYVVIPVAVLALLVSLFVRQHFTKR